MQDALSRQRETYLNGAAGISPVIPFDFDKLAALARKRMTAEGYAYVAGGAGTDDSVSENRLAFGRWRILPRMLRDVSQKDLSIELFGQKLPGPLLLSPVGVLSLAHRQADKAVARAAASQQIPMIFSNQASTPMEDIAAEMGQAVRWFQLYWSKSNELVESLVQRAEASGCSAIVVTLDTTMLGWRIQDLDLAYLPFLRGLGIAQYTSDPVFQQLMQLPDTEPAPPRKITPASIGLLMQLARNYPGSFWQNLRSGDPIKAVRTFTRIYTNPALNWDDLAFLREKTSLPILLKGILHPEDARKAMDHGVDGIIVSNHGGRQVDGSIASIDALPGIAAVVQDKVPLILDSGLRGGADIFKAIALGAKAICVGRPYVYGLAAAGEAGVAAVINNLMADFELTMALSGCAAIQEIGPHCLKRVG
ncbi:MAG: alpha-hydroxy-acid oxidizing protein [Bacteroidota bacterium]